MYFDPETSSVVQFVVYEEDPVTPDDWNLVIADSIMGAPGPPQFYSSRTLNVALTGGTRYLFGIHHGTAPVMAWFDVFTAPVAFRAPDESMR